MPFDIPENGGGVGVLWTINKRKVYDGEATNAWQDIVITPASDTPLSDFHITLRF